MLTPAQKLHLPRAAGLTFGLSMFLPPPGQSRGASHAAITSLSSSSRPAAPRAPQESCGHRVSSDARWAPSPAADGGLAGNPRPPCTIDPSQSPLPARGPLGSAARSAAPSWPRAHGGPGAEPSGRGRVGRAVGGEDPACVPGGGAVPARTRPLRWAGSRGCGTRRRREVSCCGARCRPPAEVGVGGEGVAVGERSWGELGRDPCRLTPPLPRARPTGPAVPRVSCQKGPGGGAGARASPVH